MFYTNSYELDTKLKVMNSCEIALEMLKDVTDLKEIKWYFKKLPSR